MKRDRLKTPLWQTLVYLLLLVGGPIITIYVATICSYSNDTMITITLLNGSKAVYVGFLTVFIMGIIALIMINNFMIKPWKRKLETQIATLELNYNTGVGNKIATKRMWAEVQLKKYAWDAFTTIVIAFGIYWLLAKRLSWTNASLQLCLIIMFASIFFAVAFKIFCYLALLLKKDAKEEPKEETNQ